MTILKHLLSFISGLLFCFAVMVILSAVQQRLFNSRTYEDKFFSAQAWQQYEDINERTQMIKDLQYHYISRAMSVEELTRLLGKSDFTKGDSILIFNIGSTGILASDQTLTFKLNDRKRIEDFKIGR
jgi:hypothetical protein